jgi:hypothetical protein
VQRSTDSDRLILVVLSQNVQPPYSQIWILPVGCRCRTIVAWS